MSASLPPPLDQMVAAINGGDTDGFLALFSDKGAVIDWGRRFAGRAAIKKWSDKETIGARGQMTIISARRENDRIAFTADWKSNVFSGTGDYLIILDGHRIRELRILES